MFQLNRLSRRLATWRVGSQLAAAFGAVLVFTGLLGVSAIVSLAWVNQASSELAAKWMPGLQDTMAMRAAILEVRDFEFKHGRAPDASYMAEYEDKMTAAAQRLEQHLADYRSRVTGGDEATLFEALTKGWQDYQSVNKKVVALSHGGKQEDARDISDGASKMAADDVIDALDKLGALNFESGRATAERAEALNNKVRNGTVVLMVGALLIGLSLAVFITRHLQRQLGGEPADAARLARAVADGDLSTRISLRPGDDASLMACLSHMQESLSRVVHAVRQGSEHVATASAEIAQGNNDLSQRTEQQATALQQATASMDQLGTTVDRNAENARQADSLASSASDVAQRGGAAVAQVVGTMKTINESSRRISDITGVIDGIAFQTNILALNAAVEAARAGEQGRGFAVVAGEVRLLAQRSADAAREIKLLISASVERVDQGTRQADEAGDTMTEVVSSIQRVTHIMSEISAASADQSTGVQQMGTAVSQIDHGTQQNAALVEESAAAAESLRSQAQQLVQAVAVFKL
jgi:methyl-accepting chemotaxis protein